MQSPSNDPISELLLGMRLFGVQFRRLEVVPPMGVGFTNAIGRAQFHFVGRGPVWLRSAENVLYKLDTGDAVLIPRGGHHAMLTIENTSASDVQRFDPSTGISDGVQDQADAGEGGAVDQAIIFSCCMELELGGMQPLVAAMPDVMQVSTLLETCPELRPMLEAMEREALMLQAGHAGILARLAEVVAALLVRGWVAGGCGNATGWLGALQDPRLSRAIVMMHQHPGRSWTVATLAHEARHSRSVFAQRFLEATGKPPLQYLTELRMRLALHSLSREQHSVEAVANQLGYGSLAAFSRAFKRTVGISPGAVRAAKSVDG
ncbi:AraC family transcriptional regulator [Pseudomonas amygdali pv. tabaci str. ATCC 11528]|uniref:Transcriptional regulator n=5 Tax=Pseudomonas syringae group genomosp. 2 TaxID=251698 RepID=A0A3M6H712_PSEAJ|nr:MULTISPECIES: AraC family transcriptional regulator [Pseudomonas syringae group]ARA80704.1 AraC family transcriptional regulator [Pseudomonas amygdali pv. lachrymans]KEZ28929.1 AraC family transcriptional regulator [Pseudomonas amygdali pv. tabaci str. 6605]KEZ66283.1 AraC family transcriptional regulator [Pseudomonas amygdali pv. tabaci str. ATCC 11528]KIY19201.1 AraC family transcriptional regulator [Pseudomonas amygdali pv. tabaci]KKY50134.1 AraC family transcriptional regulator [Pseudom